MDFPRPCDKSRTSFTRFRALGTRTGPFGNFQAGRSVRGGFLLPARVSTEKKSGFDLPSIRLAYLLIEFSNLPCLRDKSRTSEVLNIRCDSNRSPWKLSGRLIGPWRIFTSCSGVHGEKVRVDLPSICLGYLLIEFLNLPCLQDKSPD